MTRMIDRANVNAMDPSYSAAHASGIGYAAFKATEGSGFVDGTYHTRRKDARAAGILTGAYMFSDNGNPKTEVDHFLDVIGDLGARPGELRPTLDIERSPGGVPTLSHTIAMAEHARARLGYWPIIYGSTSVIAGYRAESIVVRACPYWRAEYGPNDGRDHGLAGGDDHAALHQYTSVGHVPGVAGFTDVSSVLRPDQILVPKPHPKAPQPLPAVAWRWGRWRLGLGEYQNHRQDPAMRPRHAPKRIPLSWYRTVRWYKRNVIQPAKSHAAVAPDTMQTPHVDGNGHPVHVDEQTGLVVVGARKRTRPATTKQGEK